MNIAVCQLAKYSHFVQGFFFSFFQEREKTVGFLEFRNSFAVQFIAVISLGENGKCGWGLQTHEQPEDMATAAPYVILKGHILASGGPAAPWEVHADARSLWGLSTQGSGVVTLSYMEKARLYFT